jgi:hypothetical protein
MLYYRSISTAHRAACFWCAGLRKAWATRHAWGYEDGKDKAPGDIEQESAYVLGGVHGWVDCLP